MENQGLEVLVGIMTNEQLGAYKTAFPNNAEVAKLVDGIIAGRLAEANKAKIKIEFEAKVSKLAKLPQPPDGIHNVYMAWAEVEVDDTSKAQAEVEVAGVKESRYPKIKVWQWVITTNKAFSDKPKEKTDKEVKVGKLAIHVMKMNKATMVMESIGKYANGALACRKLGVDAGVGSGNLALTKAGYYVVTGYEGTDIIKE
jgi:hypothetical protein